MAYTLQNMIRDGISTLGRVAFNKFTCTGGSTLTAVNTNFNAVGKPAYDDGDKSLILGTLLVIATTDGAAPQGEYQRISGYTQSTGTITVDTVFTAALEAGDRCMIIHNQYGLEDMIELANQTLTDLGYFYTIDTSLTTSATSNYTLPIAGKGSRPYSIEIYVADDKRVPITDWRYITAAPGSTATIQFQEDPPTGKTLYITYKHEHARLADFDDVVDESIPEAVAKWGLSVAIQRWQNPSDGIELQFLQEAKSELRVAQQRWKRWKPRKLPKWAIYE